MAQRRRSQRRKRFVVLLGILAVLVIAAGAGLYLYSHNEKNSKIDYKTDAEGNVASVNPSSGYRYNEHLSNFLFLGIDGTGTVDSIESVWDIGQADTILLLSYNRAEETVRTLVIPRDTITEIETFNPMGRSLGISFDHLNLQYAYGDGKLRSCEITKDAVTRLLGGVIPIQGYASLRMDGIPLLSEELDGVEVTVPDSSMEDVDDGFHEGEKVLLTEANTERFLRYRDTGISQSAIVRQERQKAYMDAFVKKAKEVQEKDASLVTRFFETLKPYLVTNMGNDQFAKLLMAENLGSVSLPGEGVEGEIYDEFYVDPVAAEDLLLEMFFEKA